MRTLIPILTILSVSLSVVTAAKRLNPADAERRAEIPLGPPMQPNPQREAIIAVGHGARILLSADDGATWEQVFKGLPNGDHGPWSCKTVAYTDGVFVAILEWGSVTTWLATEDGYNWRHLTDGNTIFKQKDDPTAMPSVWGLGGAKGTFVGGASVEVTMTPDFGVTWHSTNLKRQFGKTGPRKLSMHHMGVSYLGETSGRFLAYADDRTRPQREVMVNLFASDDGGQNWEWIQPTGLDDVENQFYKSMTILNGNPAMITKNGDKLYLSEDGGESWTAYATGISAKRADLSLVGNELWVVTEQGSRASIDGKNWRDLPSEIPLGKIITTAAGTLINVNRHRFSILRSTDQGQSWSEAYSYEGGDRRKLKGAQGLRDIQVGKITAQPIR